MAGPKVSRSKKPAKPKLIGGHHPKKIDRLVTWLVVAWDRLLKIRHRRLTGEPELVDARHIVALAISDCLTGPFRWLFATTRPGARYEEGEREKLLHAFILETGDAVSLNRLVGEFVSMVVHRILALHKRATYWERGGSLPRGADPTGPSDDIGKREFCKSVAAEYWFGYRVLRDILWEFIDLGMMQDWAPPRTLPKITVERLLPVVDVATRRIRIMKSASHGRNITNAAKERLEGALKLPIFEGHTVQANLRAESKSQGIARWFIETNPKRRKFFGDVFAKSIHWLAREAKLSRAAAKLCRGDEQHWDETVAKILEITAFELLSTRLLMATP